jgi:thiamine pyrophosphate-dependent acetolactate synthase large subunit-like protein
MIQHRKYDNRFIGVDLHNPDFGLLAQAFGVRTWRVDSEPTLETALREAVACGETALVEMIVKGK